MLQAAGRNVPIVWMGDKVDLSGSDSDGENGRRGYAVRALVHHRIVGSLESAIATFTNQNTSGRTRRVCSTFGIGFLGSTLTIVQFVAIQDTAYCNGQTDGDVKALLSTRPWSVYSAVRRAAGGHVSANYFTVSTEHEDNGAAGDYIVRTEVAEASMALDRALLTGDPRIIRGAGIRCSDAAAAQLGQIVPTKETIVDHNRCSPVSKPYCWKPYDGDKVGFPQAAFLAALTGGVAPAPAPSEDDMYPIVARTTPALVTVPAGKWIYTNQDFTADVDNAQTSETRDYLYFGRFRNRAEVVGLALSYTTPGGDVRMRFVKEADAGSIVPYPTSGGDTISARQAEWDRCKAELRVEAVLPPRPA